MRISLSQEPRAFRRGILAPDLGKAQEEPLLRRESVLGGCYFGIHLHVFMQGCKSDLQPAIVSRVFAKRQPAVEMNVIHRDKRAIFIGNAACALVEFVAISLRPPVREISFRVELAALIVKAMRELMANDHANAAEVHGIVFPLVKERRLQYACG